MSKTKITTKTMNNIRVQKVANNWAAQGVAIFNLTNEGFDWKDKTHNGSVFFENGILTNEGEMNEPCTCGEFHGYRMEVGLM